MPHASLLPPHPVPPHLRARPPYRLRARRPIFGIPFSPLARLAYFVIAENIVIIVKIAIGAYIQDMTPHTALQLQRQEYLVQKHIFGVVDAAPACRRALALMRAATAGCVITASGVVMPAAGLGPVRPAHTWATMVRHAQEAGMQHADL